MKKKKSNILICLIAISLLIWGITLGNDKAGEQINWKVISSGGSINGVSTNCHLSGTVAQSATGMGSSASYQLSHGFWQDFSDNGSGCCNMAGDANNNNAVNILDATYLINYLYKGGPGPECDGEGDANGNGAINILDVTYLINYLYKSGPEPVCP